MLENRRNLYLYLETNDHRSLDERNKTLSLEKKKQLMEKRGVFSGVRIPAVCRQVRKEIMKNVATSGG